MSSMYCMCALPPQPHSLVLRAAPTLLPWLAAGCAAIDMGLCLENTPCCDVFPQFSCPPTIPPPTPTLRPPWVVPTPVQMFFLTLHTSSNPASNVGVTRDADPDGGQGHCSSAWLLPPSCLPALELPGKRNRWPPADMRHKKDRCWT